MIVSLRLETRQRRTYRRGVHQPFFVPIFHSVSMLSRTEYSPSSRRRAAGTRKIHSPARMPPIPNLLGKVHQHVNFSQGVLVWLTLSVTMFPGREAVGRCIPMPTRASSVIRKQDDDTDVLTYPCTGDGQRNETCSPDTRYQQLEQRAPRTTPTTTISIPLDRFPRRLTPLSTSGTATTSSTHYTHPPTPAHYPSTP